MSDKILSIIVPSYNMEAYLPKCLGSLVVDDLKLLQRLDVIVVNDGSKDRTSEIARKFESQYPGVFRVVDKCNGNYGSCINAALAIATGEFIKTVDADDYVEGKDLAQLLKEIMDLPQSSDVDLILCDYSTVDAQGSVIGKKKFRLMPGEEITLDDLLDKGVRFSMHAVTYRRKIFDSINYKQTEGVSYTDTEWVTRPLCRVRRVKYIDCDVYRYLTGRTGQTISDFERKYDVFANIVVGLASTFDCDMDSAVPTSRRYYENDMNLKVAAVYHKCLVEGLDKILGTGVIYSFDSALKTNAYSLYKGAENLSEPTLCGCCKYVKDWRENGAISRKSKLSMIGKKLLSKALNKLIG